MHKIIATLGPASCDMNTIKAMAEAGVDIFRLNMSHTPVHRVDPWLRDIRAVTDKPVWLDTQGPQIRTNPGVDRTLNAGERVWLDPTESTENSIGVIPENLNELLQPGDVLQLDFNGAAVQVLEVSQRSKAVRCKCTSTGYVGENKAIACDRYIELPFLTDRDKQTLGRLEAWGIEGIALSFTRNKQDIAQASLLSGGKIPITAKVESMLAMDHIEDIVLAADSILIDRGDLSRSMPMEYVPYAQKDVIAFCNQNGVPVYVATNLLESMVSRQEPTRAEVNDIVNTLVDGADGLVLAAETAIGKYPVQCVEMVRRIVVAFEEWDREYDTEEVSS